MTIDGLNKYMRATLVTRLLDRDCGSGSPREESNLPWMEHTFEIVNAWRTLLGSKVGYLSGQKWRQYTIRLKIKNMRSIWAYSYGMLWHAMACYGQRFCARYLSLANVVNPISNHHKFTRKGSYVVLNHPPGLCLGLPSTDISIKSYSINSTHMYHQIPLLSHNIKHIQTHII